MTLKEKIQAELKGYNVKLRYFAKSPYQLRRYKPEFVEEECWVYTTATKYGYCITTEDFENEEYKEAFLDMIKTEAGKLTGFDIVLPIA